MGRRRRDGHGPGREELLVAAGGAAGTSTRAPGNVGDHLLTLQQTHGNRAVTTIVQRKGSKAASTDAPDYKKPKEKKGKGKPKEVGYAPEVDPTVSGLSVGELNTAGLDAWKKPDANGIKEKRQRDIWFEKAARYFEQAWLKTPGKPAQAIALNIFRVYSDMGDTKRKDWWTKVHTGEIDPRAPVKEDMSDKSF